MKKRIISTILLVASALTLLSGYALTAEQRALADKLVRLHVVANSDSKTDQAVKLQVRDAVLAETRRLLADETDPIPALRAGLPAIEAAANRTLAGAGSTDRAAVSLGPELFPTRDYETFSLPAGRYTALRVTIGEGQGHNWWCVVFPPLCLSASAGELEAAAQAAGLSDGEIALITGESGGYELKFKALEWLEQFQDWFS